MVKIILKRCYFPSILFLLNYFETFLLICLFVYLMCLSPLKCEFCEGRDFIFGAPELESSVKVSHKNFCPSNNTISSPAAIKEMVTILLFNCENLVAEERPEDSTMARDGRSKTLGPQREM